MKEQIGFLHFWQERYSGGGNPWTLYVNRNLGAILAYLSYKSQLSPNQVTLLSLITSLTAHLLYYFLPNTFVSYFLLIAIYQIAYSFDCADGQLARVIQQSSYLGKWLDVAIDLFSILCLPLVMVIYNAVHYQESVVFILLGLLFAYSRSLLIITATLIRQTQITRPTSISSVRIVYRIVSDTGILLLIIPLARISTLLFTIILITYTMFFMAQSLFGARTLAKHYLNT